jgi:hypothetical protein
MRFEWPVEDLEGEWLKYYFGISGGRKEESPQEEEEE